MPSSIRGLNTFLSSLRVFADKINAKNMDEGHQNNVLTLIHQVTRYFPAVRAFRILMDGKTLRPNECAAIVQSIAEALRDLVPQKLIENDERRYLEGTRLLLGFILHKLKPLSRKAPAPGEKPAEDDMPYLKFLRTVDLLDVNTNENIVDPVQTNLGLMEKGCFDAFKPGGILNRSGAENNTVLSINPDRRALRAALSTGGTKAESSYYDTDALQGSLSYDPGTTDPEKDLQSFSKELSSLGMRCHSTGMTVLHPTSLKSASAPVLTLDRDGYLCVYVGRAACAPPDRDVSIFRPVAATEEAIDVNVVAQLLEPIIAVREQDGTLVFDHFSDSASEKHAKPTELVMFCVDCSRSMDRASDFHEIHETPISSMVREAAVDDLPVTENVDDPINLDDMKNWLADHESFEDMVAIVASACGYDKRAAAEEVLDFASMLTSRELVAKGKKFVTTRSWATRSYMAGSIAPLDLQVGSLRRLLGGLNIYRPALCDFLLFKAQSLTEVEDFNWTYGEPIPRTETASSLAAILQVADGFSIPPEIVCPISQAVFEDPVTTSDNFTYERRSIERWFQIRPSSPSTGLPLGDLSLRRHQLLHDQSKRWISGNDILQAAPPAPKRRGRANSRFAADLILNFVTPAGTFSRKVPSTLSLTDLYKLAYRGMRGIQKSFSLYFHGSRLEWSNEELGSRRITSGSDIVANFYPAVSNEPTLPENDSEPMCLVKVYSLTSELFSYWIPRDTSHSIASILFRYWRFRASSSRGLSGGHQDIWSGLEKGGDGLFLGERHNHWDLLANTFNHLSSWKLLSAEELLAVPLLEESSRTDTIPANNIPSNLPTRYRVLKVALFPYRSPETMEFERNEKLRRLTRLAVSKQVFGAFINRLIAYNYPTAMGLVSCGTSASLAQPLTSIIENFRHAVDTLEAAGDTALWDSLNLAADQLNHHGQKYPGIKKRIICLSDGIDTKSVATVNDICRRLVRDKIVLDSCLIGMEDNSDLRALSFLTGGYKFVPSTLEQAVAVCELEPVLSIHERPSIVQPIMIIPGSLAFAAVQAVPDKVTRDRFPVRKSHPNLKDNFIRIDSFDRSTRTVAAQKNDDNPIAKSMLRQRRLLDEIRNIAANPHPSYDVYVSESNIGFWKVILSGPAESAYATGTFVLYLDMSDDYPQSPPQGRFITRIFHPNINLGGRICHSIFSRNYTVDITNKQVLDTVFGLLLVPEFTDPINTVVTLNFYWDEVAFRDEVKKHIQKHALKGREELGKEILGQESETGQTQ
jgi:ubiquitin-protein ligase/Mg-chelatase subunit ChlD